MPATTITGLASGIQWADTVESLMEIERAPMVKLIERQDEADRKKDAWTGIQNALETFQARSKDIDTIDELVKMTVSSSDTSYLTATANADAIPSTHNIEINQLAQGEVEVHDGWADVNTTAVKTGGAGQFDYTFAGTSYSVTVPSGATLVELI